MYKDKTKQREANRERQRRYKAKQKALLIEGVTGEALPKEEPIKFERFDIPERVYFTLKEQLAKRYPSLTVMERLFYRPANKLGIGEHNFVSLPGQACYGVNMGE